MTFSSQICTTREQSERLLALGLKKETADMYITNMSIKGLSYTDDWEIGSSSYLEVISFWEASGLKTERTAWEIIPAWSLHRLIELNGDLLSTLGALQLNSLNSLLEENVYELIIDLIKFNIEEGDFDKEFLEDSR